MRSAMIIQPGGAGDIMLCLPIAKWYADAGYTVYWPLRSDDLKHLRYIDYVMPIRIDDDELQPDPTDWRIIVKWCLTKAAQIKIDTILNLADRGPHPTAQLPGENFEQVKYRLASVPFEEKHNLDWNLDNHKATHVHGTYVTFPGQYAFVHTTSSHNEETELPDISLPIVRCEDFDPKYNIFDWYYVITGADEIYVTESSVWAFCDGIINDLTPNRYLIAREKMGNMTTISSHWNRKYLKC